ncbi:MAG: hypothetical protein ACOH2M_12430 [Cypionkella sp.]
MSSFFATVITVLAHTPLWVWPLYALLLFLGFQRTRDSIIPLWRMLILPIVVTLLAILSVVLAGSSALPALLLGLIVGGPIGWLIDRKGNTRRLSDGTLWLRGEWLTMVQIVLVLVFRYATSVTAGLHPSLLSNLTWRLSTVFIATILSAMFLGRTAARLRIYFAGATTAV